MKTPHFVVFLACCIVGISLSTAQAAVLSTVQLKTCADVTNLQGIAGVNYVVVTPITCSGPIVVNVPPPGTFTVASTGSLNSTVSVTINNHAVLGNGQGGGGIIINPGQNGTIGTVTNGTGTIPTPSYDFDYDIVAIDALTKGSVTLDTRQIELGVLIHNNSKNVVGGSSVTFKFSQGALETGRGLILQSVETDNALYLSSSLDTLGKTFIFANVKPTAIAKALPKDVILADLTVEARVVSSVDSSLTIQRKTVKNIAYTFSNSDLIPAIASRLK